MVGCVNFTEGMILTSFVLFFTVVPLNISDNTKFLLYQETKRKLLLYLETGNSGIRSENECTVSRCAVVADATSLCD